MSIVLLLFTLIQTKLEWYILPAYPAFAIAIGDFLYQLSKKIKPTISVLAYRALKVVTPRPAKAAVTSSIISKRMRPSQ
jgi:hypothetical protein